MHLLSSLSLYRSVFLIEMVFPQQRVEKAIKEKTCNALLLKVPIISPLSYSIA